MSAKKIQSAINAIAQAKSIGPEGLIKVLVNEVGDDLVNFLYSYAESLCTVKNRQKPLAEVLATALLMGYLIRTNEVHSITQSQETPKAKA